MSGENLMIICPRCLLRNADGASICARCGGPLAPDWLALDAKRAAQRAPTAAPVRSGGAPAKLPDAVAAALASPAAAVRGGPRIRLRLDAGKIFELSGKSRYLIGRYDERNDLMPDVDLTDWNGAASGVSRQHAIVHVVGDAIYIEDLGSRNETVRNGARLITGQRYPLHDGDRIGLGTIGMSVMVG
jgi:FHA domain-containing protein